MNTVTLQVVDAFGIGPGVAAELLVTVGDNSNRTASKAAFARRPWGVSHSHRLGGPPGTDSAAKATAKPTPRCSEPSCGCDGTSPRSPTFTSSGATNHRAGTLDGYGVHESFSGSASLAGLPCPSEMRKRGCHRGDARGCGAVR